MSQSCGGLLIRNYIANITRQIIVRKSAKSVLPINISWRIYSFSSLLAGALNTTFLPTYVYVFLYRSYYSTLFCENIRIDPDAYR